MNEQINLLKNLAVNARNYVKRAEIAPVNSYIDFGGGLRAYCTPAYDYFSIYYDNDTQLIVHNISSDVDKCTISHNVDTTEEHLQTLCDKAFAIMFEYEKNQAEVLEKQRIAQIAELESKLARLRDL